MSSVIKRESDGTLTIVKQEDVSAILEDAKGRSNSGLHGSSEFKHAAHLPGIVVEKYCLDKGITFHEWMANPIHLRAMLNDPALADFRIWKGRC